MGQFVKAGLLSEIPPGGAKLLEIQGKEIALFNAQGALYALDNSCPHAAGPLAEGSVEGDEVECPWHGARFNLKTGVSLTAVSPEGVQTYSVRVNGNDIEIEL